MNNKQLYDECIKTRQRVKAVITEKNTHHSPVFMYFE